MKASTPPNLLGLTLAELVSQPIDQQTYLAVSRWLWAMRSASGGGS